VAQLVEALRYTTDTTGSIFEGFIGIFRWINPSDRIMALGSTRSLTEMSTRGLKAASPRYQLNVPIVMKLEISNFWYTKGLSRPVMR
jgi:hypothetical protein